MQRSEATGRMRPSTALIAARNMQRTNCNTPNGNMQHAARNIRNTACNSRSTQHATRSTPRNMQRTQHAACTTEHATTQHAACNRAHATCNMQHATRNRAHATRNIRTWTVFPRYSPRRSRSITCRDGDTPDAACNTEHAAYNTEHAAYNTEHAAYNTEHETEYTRCTHNMQRNGRRASSNPPGDALSLYSLPRRPHILPLRGAPLRTTSELVRA